MAREVLAGFPTFNITKDGITAALKIKTDWDDIDALVLELMPEPRVVGTAVLGAETAAFPGRPHLRVESVSIEPFDKNNSPTTTGTGLGENDTITHPVGGAVLSVSYKGREQDCPDDDEQGQNIEYSIDIQADVMTLPNSGLKWDAANDEGKTHVNEDLQAGIVLPMIEHNVTMTNVPNPPMDAIRASIGKLNEADFRGAAEATAMFAGASVTLGFSPRGNPVYTVNYRILERGWQTADGNAVTWLMMYRSKPAAADQHWQVITQEDGEDIYQSTDFSELFNMDAIDDEGTPCEDQ